MPPFVRLGLKTGIQVSPEISVKMATEGNTQELEVGDAHNVKKEMNRSQLINVSS